MVCVQISTLSAHLGVIRVSYGSSYSWKYTHSKPGKISSEYQGWLKGWDANSQMCKQDPQTGLSDNSSICFFIRLWSLRLQGRNCSKENRASQVGSPWRLLWCLLLASLTLKPALSFCFLRKRNIKYCFKWHEWFGLLLFCSLMKCGSVFYVTCRFYLLCLSRYSSVALLSFKHNKK